jgi:hypothetical protein
MITHFDRIGGFDQIMKVLDVLPIKMFKTYLYHLEYMIKFFGSEEQAQIAECTLNQIVQRVSTLTNGELKDLDLENFKDVILSTRYFFKKKFTQE